MKTVVTSLVTVFLFCPLPVSAEDFWARHTIDSADQAAGKQGADGVRIGDINHDGLADLVTGWEEGDAIRVCLNPGPDKAADPWPAVTVGRANHTEDAVFGDLDGDGALDVISSSEGQTKTVYVHWSPKDSSLLMNESDWKTAAIPATAKKQSWMFCLPHDVDGDGDLDLIVGSKGDRGSVSWIENPGHQKARIMKQWNLHRLHDAGWIMSLSIFESDNAQWLLFSDRKGDNSGIFVIPLLSESPWIGRPTLIGGSGEEVMFLDLAHLDDDTRIDIVAAIRPDNIRVLHQPQQANVPWIDTSELEPIPGDRFGTAKAVKVADVTGDNIPDFIITCEHSEKGKSGVLLGNVFSEFSSISGPEGIKFDRMELLDLDGDGDLDVITCEERDSLGVVWYENPFR